MNTLILGSILYTGCVTPYSPNEDLQRKLIQKSSVHSSTLFSANNFDTNKIKMSVLPLNINSDSISDIESEREEYIEAYLCNGVDDKNRDGIIMKDEIIGQKNKFNTDEPINLVFISNIREQYRVYIRVTKNKGNYGALWGVISGVGRDYFIRTGPEDSLTFPYYRIVNLRKRSDKFIFESNRFSSGKYFIRWTLGNQLDFAKEGKYKEIKFEVVK